MRKDLPCFHVGFGIWHLLFSVNISNWIVRAVKGEIGYTMDQKDNDRVGMSLLRRHFLN